jgi:hypothetical protein
MSGTLARILGRIGIPDLVQRLADALPGADFTSLMLEVMRRRAARVTPADVLQQYRRDRFVGAATVPLAALRRVEDAALGLLPADTEALALAPLAPLGAHSAIATVDQHKVVSTLRGTEVAADPTNGLALEAAHRREGGGFGGPAVHLAASQRVARAQALGGGARVFAHFQLFGLVSAGRDAGDLRFEQDGLLRQLQFHVALARACGAREVALALTPLDAQGERITAMLAAAIDATTDARVREDRDRTTGRGCYRHACFKTHVRLAGGDDWIEVGDGGDVDWTARLTSNSKERCVISGLGVDRLALG